MPELPNTAMCRVALRALIERIAAEVRKLRDSGQLTLQSQKLTLRRDFSLHYSSDPAIANFAPQEAEERVWGQDDLDVFLSGRVESSPEYAEGLRMFEGVPQGASLLRSFAWRVAYDSALEVNLRNAEQHVETILCDVGGGERKYVAKIWLTGITLAQDLLRISQDLTLRRPTRADMQERVFDQMVHYAHAFRQQTYFSCIGELHVLARQPVDVQREVDRLVTALRLFRLGSVSTGRYELRTESFSQLGNAQIGGPSGAARLQYTLSEGDAGPLERLLQVLMPVLPSPYELPTPKPDFLSTALRWQSEAMLASAPLEGTIAWAIACLEALYLDDDPKTEVLYKLKQRIASLLKCFGWPPLEVRKTITTAYDVRSKYVHGAVHKKGLSQDELTKLHREVAEYARVSCLIWAQLVLAGKRERPRIRQLLEDALIDDDSRTELKGWCKTVDFGKRSG